MKVPKASVNYRRTTSQDRRCGTCSMFRRKDHRSSAGTCTLVEGVILATYVCDQWTARK